MQQIDENQVAGLIGRDHLTVENGIVDRECRRNLLGECVEPGHDIVVAQDQTVAALLDIAEPGSRCI